MNTQLLQQASVLDVNEQIELVEAFWNGIVSRVAPSWRKSPVTFTLGFSLQLAVM
jgi:hypothetical protein